MEDSLRAHWAGKGSASTIARAMSERFGIPLSRGAILGKRLRMGLPKRAYGRTSADGRKYVRKSRAKPDSDRLIKIGPPKVKPLPVKEWVQMPYPEPLRVHFIDRTRMQCSRPLWPNKPKPSIAEMFVCGNPVEEDAKFEFCPACASNLLVPPRAGLKPFKNERVAA